MIQCLLVDDDVDLAEVTAEYLQGFDLSVTVVHHAYAALEALHIDRETMEMAPITNKMAPRHDFDVLILDVMMPDMNGLELCQTIRRVDATPVIMLTARGELADKVVGLEIGADDYLPKPFEPRELVARCKSLSRRHQLEQGFKKPELSQGWVLNDHELSVTFQQIKVVLTLMEFQALQGLMESGDTLSRDELMSYIRGSDVEIYSRSIDILMSRLRQKLKPLCDGQVIQTIRSKGYRFIGCHPQQASDGATVN